MAFWSVAALMLIGAVAVTTWPLWRGRLPRAPTAGRVNLSVHRDQLAELERDLALGTLDARQYDAARAELERRVLEEAGPGPGDPPATSSSRLRHGTAVALGLAIPAAAVSLYLLLGDPGAMVAPPHAAAPPVTPAQFKEMTQKLAERMAKSPDDPVGWLMLGRAYVALESYPEAVKALAEAERRRPGDPDILVQYAEALALQRGRDLRGEPMRLIERALATDPDHLKGLTLAGTAAFEAGDYGKVAVYWERLQRLVPADSEIGRAVADGLAQARQLSAQRAQAPALGAEAIRGEVRLAARLRAQAAPDDTLFVFARATQGSRMPVAVLKKRVRDLPFRFQLDDSLAMAPDRKLSAQATVVVTARVSKSGSVAPASGDLQGDSAAVRPGAAGVTVVIDQVVP